MHKATLHKAFVTAAALAFAASTAQADSVADFYSGKTVTIVAATGAGSAYGLHGQLLSEAWRRHIPGNPTVVMQYMPGGGGSKQANYIYNVAPKDGTWIGFPLKYVAVNQALGRPGLKYDAAKFGYIGSLGPINSAVIIMKKNAPVTTLEGAMRTEIIMGATGKSSETFITPTLMNNLLGTKFKIVAGYQGMKSISIAMERGEVHGRAGSWDSLKSGDTMWLDDNLISIIALSGLERNWDLRNVPTLIDLAKTPEQEKVLRFFGAGNAVGWLFMAPPGVPAKRLDALRKAFDATMADREYRAVAAEKNLDLQPANAETVKGYIDETLDVTPEQLAAIRKAMGL